MTTMPVTLATLAAARTAQATAGAGAAAQTADPLREATVPGPLSALEFRVLEQNIPTNSAYAGWFAARLPEAHPFRRFGTIAEARQGLGLITEVVSASLRAGRRNLVAAAALIPIGGLALAYGSASLPEAYAEWRAAKTQAEGDRIAGLGTEEVSVRLIDIDDLKEEFAEAAEATGGEMTAVPVRVIGGDNFLAKHSGIEEALKTALTIGGQTNHYRAIFVVDASSREYLILHDVARYENRIFDHLATQVKPGGTLEIAVYLAGDGKTVASLPLTAATQDDSAGLRKAFTDAIEGSQNYMFVAQSLWHTTLDLAAGPNRIPWPSKGQDTVQKVIFLTGVEEAVPSRDLVDDTEEWKREVAIRLLQQRGMEVWPIVVELDRYDNLGRTHDDGGL